mgnify:CR=1 FL=1
MILIFKKKYFDKLANTVLWGIYEKRNNVTKWLGCRPDSLEGLKWATSDIEYYSYIFKVKKFSEVDIEKIMPSMRECVKDNGR